MAVAQRIDLNHYAVLDADPFHELVGAKIVCPGLDFKVPGRLLVMPLAIRVFTTRPWTVPFLVTCVGLPLLVIRHAALARTTLI